MAVLAAILPIVSRTSALALDIYNVAAKPSHATDFLLRIAKSINNFGLIVKQVGTIVKEDDRLPSAEAIESLEDVLDQANAVLKELETFIAEKRNSKIASDHGRGNRRSQDLGTQSRIAYLIVHLDSLRWTLAVMLQTLHVAQSIMWASSRPNVSTRQCAIAVGHEKQQLEVFVVEQQISILQASSKHSVPVHDARLLMEDDSSQSLVTYAKGSPQASDLTKYQDTFISSLDSDATAERQWLPMVSGSARSQVDRLLYKWTSLRQFEDGLAQEERTASARTRETQQPYVDSDSEDEDRRLPKLDASGSRLAMPTQARSAGVEALFAETSSLQIPVQMSLLTPDMPNSPSAASGTPRSTRYSFGPSSLASSPTSLRTSLASLPTEAAAAVDASSRDEDVNLSIPWSLRTPQHHWNYVDGRVVDSDTKAPSSDAFAERQSWTEIAASWVCKEAIKEAGLKYRDIQRERRDGRKMMLESRFLIEQPLTFDQVHRLVERTVEIYRRAQETKSVNRKDDRRYSFEPRPRADPEIDRNRTPVPGGRPPLHKSTSTYTTPVPSGRLPTTKPTSTYGAPAAPPLDRTSSLPGKVPMYPSNPSRSSSQSSRLAIPSSPYTAQAGLPPNSAQSDLRLRRPASPLKPTRGSGDRHDYSTSGASDSDAATRSRRHRSRSRRPSDSRHRKKEHGGATKALMGVAGLTALLDGLVGI